MVAWRVELDRGGHIRIIRGKRYRNLEGESSINLFQVNSMITYIFDINAPFLRDPQLCLPIQRDSRRAWEMPTK